MNKHSQKIFGFQPSLFERLITDGMANQDNSRWTIQQLKDSVARDLEELLNTRNIPLETLDDFPHVKKAVLNFGILDFVGLSTANPLHRDQICRAIQITIADQETRLSHVQVLMHIDSDHVGSLLLTIKGVLNIRPIHEAVVFDAVLNSATQQYSIKTAGV